jgi:protein-S-isoprenylcysteine O-methyltransferase Ste14
VTAVWQQRLQAFERHALCIARKWWRPLTCWSIALGAFVNFVVIPLSNWTTPNMAEAAAYVTAATAALAVREWGKKKGNDDGPGDPQPGG